MLYVPRRARSFEINVASIHMAYLQEEALQSLLCRGHP